MIDIKSSNHLIFSKMWKEKRFWRSEEMYGRHDHETLGYDSKTSSNSERDVEGHHLDQHHGKSDPLVDESNSEVKYRTMEWWFVL